jgi:hypothetical protein
VNQSRGAYLAAWPLHSPRGHDQHQRLNQYSQGYAPRVHRVDVRYQRLPRENGPVAKAAMELIVAAERAQNGHRRLASPSPTRAANVGDVGIEAPCAGETSGIAAP